MGLIVPEVVKQTPIFNSIYGRIHYYNRNYLGLHCGGTGSGKSWGGLTECYAVDRTCLGKPRFDIDKVIFLPSKFLSWARSDPPAGSFILWDEAGVNLASREWYTKINRLIIKVLTTFRFKQLGVVFTTPSLNNVDKQARQLFHSYTEFQGASKSRDYSKSKFEWMEYNGKFDKFYFKRPRFIVGNHLEIMTSMRFPKPPKDLVEAYEKKREDQANHWYSDYDKEIKLIEKEAGNDEAQKGSLQDLCDKAIKKGLDFFIDGAKLKKGIKEVSPALLRGELNIIRSDAYDLKAFIMAKLAKGELQWPEGS